MTDHHIIYISIFYFFWILLKTCNIKKTISTLQKQYNSKDFCLYLFISPEIVSQIYLRFVRFVKFYPSFDIDTKWIKIIAGKINIFPIFPKWYFIETKDRVKQILKLPTQLGNVYSHLHMVSHQPNSNVNKNNISLVNAWSKEITTENNSGKIKIDSHWKRIHNNLASSLQPAQFTQIFKKIYLENSPNVISINESYITDLLERTWFQFIFGIKSDIKLYEMCISLKQDISNRLEHDFHNNSFAQIPNLIGKFVCKFNHWKNRKEWIQIYKKFEYFNQIFHF